MLVNSAFTVEGVSNLAIKSYNVPKKIKKGNAYSIKGKVSSNNEITKVTVRITDSKGKVKCGASANPEGKSFDIKKLDYDIRFGKLAKGTYYYKVIATDTVKTKTLLNRKFTVY